MIKEKRNAGRRAAEYIGDGMVVGLGTGSTAKHAVKKASKRIREESIDMVAVPTSEQTEQLADDLNIPLRTLDEVDRIDLTIDGADEVGPDYNLIKGGGGALLREKMVALNSDEIMIVVDPTKIVDKLGLEFKLPLEIVQHWTNTTTKMVEDAGRCSANIRKHENMFYKTDNGNYILDCNIPGIDEPVSLSNKMNKIPGVIENGLFIDVADMIIVGKEEGFEEISVD